LRITTYRSSRVFAAFNSEEEILKVVLPTFRDVLFTYIMADDLYWGVTNNIA
jgi:hypothetical protein